ncbi:2,3-dimethylmalate dehydratase large subunit [Gimesia panareensis]|uniref:2,3-dimethylmalate dehydratase large subunit n=1 Tax=Gimesia panareensis TaxID=2527978 RepID=A0A517QB08_9PLAN|nr:aconitate hydratase [Gimesia panareensis]QDT28812.1 2,3-dimethylmalate dehydratase large subunit [Gimesia panareensis]
MSANLAQKLIHSHLVEGEMEPGQEIGLKIDQTLTQDATGTLVMLELEAMQLDHVHTEVSVQYVDHNLLQEDFKNPDDHLFLQSACECFGLWFSRPGNGVSHPLHQEHFGIPGKTLVGSDSHSCSAGALGMLAIGAGGLEVAMAMAGFPFYLKMPEIWGIKLTGSLPDWVSAKDVILEMLRRHDVKGGVNRIIEYHGPGLKELSAMDRHVIANMGAELGATATVFPADEEVQRFLRAQGREEDFTELAADADANYDLEDEIDLSTLEPLIALPSSPGNVHKLSEVAGEPIYQAYVGSSANPGYRDFAMAAEIVKGRHVHPRVSFDINPSSRQILMSLVNQGALGALIQSGARIHQAGCNGCIGMGQAPATDKLSLRTVPRNFPGRSGTREDKVCLVSPETAAASALSGCITDPRTLEMPCPRITVPEVVTTREDLFQPPPETDDPTQFELRKGPNIKSIPDFEALPDELEVPVLLKMQDNISTDEILPAGARVLPYRSNIPAISQFAFEQIDPNYTDHALDIREAGGHAILAGENYGQGSSREHAALAPRYLGLRVAIAKSFARIHWQNLVNFGVLPLTFENPEDYEELDQDVLLHIESLRHQVAELPTVEVQFNTHKTITARHGLSERQREILLAGGLINWARSTRQKQA